MLTSSEIRAVITETPTTLPAASAATVLAPSRDALLVRARATVAHPPEPLTDELYLAYSRHGERTEWDRVAHHRYRHLAAMVLAEWQWAEGEFLTPIVELIESFCAERTWVSSAHDGNLGNFHGETVTIDLRTAVLAHELALTDGLLGERLPVSTRQAIRDNCRWRVFAPYRRMVAGEQAQHWLNGTSNWNAVCLAGVTSAALALIESPDERSWYIEVAQRHIQCFLSGFSSDGYCSEGTGYWNYGFGHYVILAEAIRAATGGVVDLMAGNGAREPAMFGRRAAMAPGLYPAFADCKVGAHPQAALLGYLDCIFGGTQPPSELPEDGSLARIFAWSVQRPPVGAAPDAAASDRRSWFHEAGVLIGRDPASSFCVAMKGGHNSEHHNHNDLGSFILAVNGVQILADPGAEVYTSRTFSEKRYDSELLNSRGHSVPLVAGQMQASGGAARARVLDTAFIPDHDRLVIDLAGAYDVPGLLTLERSFDYVRAPQASFIVRDRFSFKAPEQFETALIIFGSWSWNGSWIQVTDGTASVRVHVESSTPFDIVEETIDGESRTVTRPKRLAIRLRAAATEGYIETRAAPQLVSH